ncbi:MAG: copper homeostasis protein CutC [Erysipelotrichaceae bacterium]|nr:copper homeostasis protein CutC [Erysipelotrichaceae bacterium]
MINGIKIEICIGNLNDALIASKYPIDRIELNCALELGGLSPSLETLKAVKDKISTPVCTMVRPRGGDFIYNDIEFETMLKDAKNFLEAGSDGIVFGFTTKDLNIDIKRTKEMVELIHSYNKEAVFHKAFDVINDQEKGIKELIDLKIDRILTSGKADYSNILEGCQRINNLHKKYGEKIQLLPGGGVRIHNIKDVVNTCDTHQVHMTSKKENPGGYLELDTDQLEKLLKELQTI